MKKCIILVRNISAHKYIFVQRINILLQKENRLWDRLSHHCDGSGFHLLQMKNIDGRWLILLLTINEDVSQE